MALIPVNLPWGQTKPPYGTPINTAHPLSQGLAGAWLMNERGGGKLYDISGNNNTGTINGASWANGQFGGCLSFNGTSNNITASGTSVPIGNSSRTVSVWINSPSYSGSSANNFAVGISSVVGSNTAYLLGVNNSGHFLITTAGVANDLVVPGFSLNKWYNLVSVYNGAGLLSMYVNGSLVGTKNIGSTNTTNGAIYIGTAGVEFFNGLIDDTLIYSRALSATEVQQLYQDPFCFMQPRRLWLSTTIQQQQQQLLLLGVGA